MKNFKSFLVVTLLLFAGLSANAQTEKGRMKVGGTLLFNSGTPSVTYEFDGTNETYKGEPTSVFVMTPSFSYFVIDNLAVGVDLSFLSVSSKLEEGEGASKGNLLAFMPNVSYYFNTSSNFKPYLRGGVGYGRLSLGAGNVSSNHDGFVAAGTVGGAYFITNNVALDLGVNYTFASSKIGDEGVTSKYNINNFGAFVGFSIFF